MPIEAPYSVRVNQCGLCLEIAMLSRMVTTSVPWIALPVFLIALLISPTQGYCDDDVLRSTHDAPLVFNDGPSTVGDDGLVEVKTNDPKCPKILWYPPLGHFICMPPEVAVGNGGTNAGRNNAPKGSPSGNPGRSSRR